MPALACACALALTAAPAPAGEQKPAPEKRDATEAILISLLHDEVQLKEGNNINEIPVFELLQELSRKHNLTLVINEESFKEVGIQNFKEDKPNLATTQLRGLHLHQFLRVVLGSMGATFLVRNNSIEIVPVEYAAKMTKSPLLPPSESTRPQLREPLVSFIVKEKPLNETVAEIAKRYDLTVVVSPQAGDARTGFVSARVLNMPAEKALELLALQADLRVVRRGAAFLITSKDQANELFEEELNRERLKVELQKFREMPVKPVAAPMNPAPQK
jgi:hypothetical protein